MGKKYHCAKNIVVLGRMYSLRKLSVLDRVNNFYDTTYGKETYNWGEGGRAERALYLEELCSLLCTA